MAMELVIYGARQFIIKEYHGVLYFLDYVGNICIMILWVLVSILNPNRMYLPLLLTVYCNTIYLLRLHSLCNSILLLPCLVMYYKYNAFVFAIFLVFLHVIQYNGGLLPDIILLTRWYYHRGTRLNAMKRFCICSL